MQIQIICSGGNFYVDCDKLANFLSSNDIKSYPLAIFSSKNNNQNKILSGPWILLPEDAYYLYTTQNDVQFYHVDDALPLPPLSSLNKPDSNIFHTFRSPQQYSKSLTSSEILSLFKLDQKLYNTYLHFRQLGYYVTSGSKYGMHYLAYCTNPQTAHATFTIYVWRNDTSPPTDRNLAAMCRSANYIRKDHVLVTFNDLQMKFRKLVWNGDKVRKEYLQFRKVLDNSQDEVIVE